MSIIRKRNPKYYKIDTMSGNNDLDRFVSFVWYNSLENEVWREIENTEAQNFVSNKGRVLSIRNNRAQILKQFIQGDGYYYVSIRYAGEKDFVDRRVNILVANAFLPNPEGKPIVHHKDTNKLNNDVSNLVFMTHKEHGEAHRLIEQQEKEKQKEAPADEALLPAL